MPERDNGATAGRDQNAVRTRSEELRKELSIGDLAFAQILFIVGLQWVGVAAKQGPAHVIFWLIAIALFYLPSAVVAVWLTRAMPLEGGLYQWAKLGFNEFVGFIVAWNLWLFAILNMTNIGLQFTQYAGYIFGPARRRPDGSRAGIMRDDGGIVIAALVWITIMGLQVGKWVHTVGGVLMLTIFAMIIALPWLNVANGTLTAFHPLTTATPAISLLSLNLLGKMGFGAFGGFEYVAIHAGECRDPVRSITRATAIAAPIIVLMFMLGTASVLALVPDRPDRSHRADPAAPQRRVRAARRRRGDRPDHAQRDDRHPLRAGECQLCGQHAPADGRRVGQPAAGVVHPAERDAQHAGELDPVRGRRDFVLSTLGLVGVGKQEAFQLLWNSAGIFYALTYLAMFAVPLWGLTRSRVRAPWWVKLCALSGLLMTILYISLSVLPIIPGRQPHDLRDQDCRTDRRDEPRRGGSLCVGATPGAC